MADSSSNAGPPPTYFPGENRPNTTEGRPRNDRRSSSPFVTGNRAGGSGLSPNLPQREAGFSPGPPPRFGIDNLQAKSRSDTGQPQAPSGFNTGHSQRPFNTSQPQGPGINAGPPPEQWAPRPWVQWAPNQWAFMQGSYPNQGQWPTNPGIYPPGPSQGPSDPNSQPQFARKMPGQQPPVEEQDRQQPNVYDYREFYDYGTRRNANFDLWAVGVIFSTPYHRPDTVESTKRANTNRCLVYQGHWVYSKLRKLVVVGIFETHVVAVPIFTYNRQGLKGKSARSRSEHIGIRDSRASNADKLRTQSTFENLIAFPHTADQARTGFHSMPANAYVHFTEPLSFDRRAPFLLEGRLGLDDSKRLAGYFAASCQLLNGMPTEVSESDATINVPMPDAPPATPARDVPMPDAGSIISSGISLSPLSLNSIRRPADGRSQDPVPRPMANGAMGSTLLDSGTPSTPRRKGSAKSTSTAAASITPPSDVDWDTMPSPGFDKRVGKRQNFKYAPVVQTAGQKRPLEDDRLRGKWQR